MRSIGIRLAPALLATAVFACGEAVQVDHSGPTAEWPGFGGGHDRTRYSALTQVDAGNVEHLEVAWTHFDDAQPDFGPDVRASFQMSPTVIGSTLSYCTSFGRVFALDAKTGDEIWRGRLPSVSGSIPSTYRLTPTSKQFVVVAAGHGADPQTLLAFALNGTD